jgi:hypothetical protein
VRLVATPVETSHHTVGQVEGTRGVLISVETEGAGGHYNCQSSALLLGDTEYQRDRGHVNAGIFEGIRRALERRDLSAVALHIGCSQLKDAPGKHLYLTGLGDILRDIDHFRLTHELGPPAPKLLVLVSEWGLEHATLDQIQTAVQGGLPGTLADAFDNESRVRKTIEVIKESYRLQTIELLPADVGLVVGLISGKVYLKGRAVPPGRIDFQPGGKGLEYSERT